MRLSLVIPTYDEAANVGRLVRRLHQVLAATGVGFELIIVDDDSPDCTWKVAAGLVQDVPSLRVIRRTGASGLATAVICGWSHARGDVLGVIDGDGQHPPEVVTDLLAAMDGQTEVAVASRHVDGGGVSDWSAIRRLLSRGAQALGLLLLPGTVGRVTDPMSGYFLVRRDVVAGVDLDPVGYKILLEVLARGEVRRVAERPYVFLERSEGESKVSAGHYVGYLRHLMRLRLHPLRSRALVRYLLVTALALVADALAFLWIFDRHGWNLTRSAAIAGEVGILLTVALHDLWTFAGRATRGAVDRIRRVLGAQIALGLLLAVRLTVLNALVNWFDLGPLAAFLIAMAAITPASHLLGSRLTWRGVTS
ncbi:MAG: sulfonate ABC transporter permease [Acidimicrobiaceae bacterium]|nr:sulfonate ABC transporter permease [Acidimicrobiaceae bacterium]